MAEINKIPDIELFASGHRACSGCGCALAMRLALKAAGKDTIVVHATGCMEVVSTPYPQTAWRVPWLHVAFETAGSAASGVEKALKVLKKDKKTNVLAIGGDGGTFDIGFQALSGMVERGHNICYLCYDNEAYMNTGIQRSGSTPKYGATTTTPAGKSIHGKMEYKKPMPLIMAANGAEYVATANVAYPQDFIEKLKKGLSCKGPAYIQIFAPCIVGWKMLPDNAIGLSKAAFQTNITPLYEIEKGVLKFTKKPAVKKNVEEYLKYQGRFKHLNKNEIIDLQKHFDSNYEKLLKIEESGISFKLN